MQIISVNQCVDLSFFLFQRKLLGFEGKDSGLASVVTLASSLDYTPSKSSLKLLLPLASV